MTDKDIKALHDVERLDDILRRTPPELASDFAERRAAYERDAQMKDLATWGPWIAAVVLVGFALWMLGVYVDATVADAVSQIGGGL
jgi:hypothetical protein